MKKITNELGGKKVADLMRECVGLRQEIAKIVLSMKSNPPKDTNTLGKKKKRLAAMMNIITQKNQGEQTAKNL
jgi:hypothetical protein